MGKIDLKIEDEKIYLKGLTVAEIIQNLDFEDIMQAIRNREEDLEAEDESLSGGLWDLAFDELSSRIDIFKLIDSEYNSYTDLGESLYNTLVENIDFYKMRELEMLEETELER